MENEKIYIQELKQYITLREEYWEYTMGTNCYAFALGLDIPENMIMKNAYQVGTIGITYFLIPSSALKEMTLDERLELDLKALGIKFCEVSIEEKLESFYKIALFLTDEGKWHFLRQSEFDGIWWQKWGGILSHPINYDFDHKIITDPRYCNLHEYKYLKTYALKREL